EITASIVIGLGIGYLLDRALGTKPWMVILFAFIGFAGGMVNLYHALELGDRHRDDDASHA
ncbi:MAG: AtpZ/AtpI family protein, partial [Zetaproteobacteria bacterium]